MKRITVLLAVLALLHAVLCANITAKRNLRGDLIFYEDGKKIAEWTSECEASGYKDVKKGRVINGPVEVEIKLTNPGIALKAYMTAMYSNNVRADGEYTAKYKTGEVASIFRIKDGKPTGTGRDFYKSGKPMAVYKYENGEAMELTANYETGEIYESARRLDSVKPDYEDVKYFQNGRVKVRKVLKECKLAGSEYYYPDGRKFNFDLFFGLNLCLLLLLIVTGIYLTIYAAREVIGGDSEMDSKIGFVVSAAFFVTLWILAALSLATVIGEMIDFEQWGFMMKFTVVIFIICLAAGYRVPASIGVKETVTADNGWLKVKKSWAGAGFTKATAASMIQSVIYKDDMFTVKLIDGRELKFGRRFSEAKVSELKEMLRSKLNVTVIVK